MRRGRPCKPESKKRRIPFSWRTTPDIRDRLIAAAEASGRSIAGEIEYRVDRSFANEDVAEVVRAAVRDAMTLHIDWERNKGNQPDPQWDARKALAEGWPDRYRGYHDPLLTGSCGANTTTDSAS